MTTATGAKRVYQIPVVEEKPKPLSLQEARQKLFDGWKFYITHPYNSIYNGIRLDNDEFLFPDLWRNPCVASIRRVPQLSIKTKTFMFCRTWGWCVPKPEQFNKDSRRYIDWLFSNQSPWREVVNKYFPVDHDPDKYVLFNGKKLRINTNDFHYDHGFFIEDEVPTQVVVHFYKAYRMVQEHPNAISNWVKLQDEGGFDPYVALNFAPLFTHDYQEFTGRPYVSHFGSHSIWANDFGYDWKLLTENMRDGKLSYDKNVTWNVNRNYQDCDAIFHNTGDAAYVFTDKFRKGMKIAVPVEEKPKLRRADFQPRIPNPTWEECYVRIREYLNKWSYKSQP